MAGLQLRFFMEQLGHRPVQLMKLTAAQRDALSRLEPSRAYERVDLVGFEGEGGGLIGHPAFNSLVRAGLLEGPDFYDRWVLTETAAKIVRQWRLLDQIAQLGRQAERDLAEIRAARGCSA